MRPLPTPGPRMAALLELMPAVALGAEIGADHGIVSAHLLAGGKCGRMVVADISAASLIKARRFFAYRGLVERTDFREADGLNALSGPVDAVLIAGMGAQTMAGILSRGLDRIGDATLVLQPNTDHHELREWLMQNGFVIEAERLVQEGWRFYIALRAVRGLACYTEKELWVGPVLLRERPPLLAEYLAWLRGCLLRMRNDGARRALRLIEEELANEGLDSEGCVRAD